MLQGKSQTSSSEATSDTPVKEIQLGFEGYYSAFISATPDVPVKLIQAQGQSPTCAGYHQVSIYSKEEENVQPLST